MNRHELGDKWQYMPWQSWHILSCDPLSLENRRLVTDEPVWVWGINTSWSSRLPEIYRSFRGIYGRIYLEWRKQNHKMSTCNWLDLESLGFWPTIYVQKPSGHWCDHICTYNYIYIVSINSVRVGSDGVGTRVKFETLWVKEVKSWI